MGTFINQVSKNNALQQDIFNFQKKDKKKQQNIKHNKLFNKLVYNKWEQYMRKLVFRKGEKVYTYSFDKVYDRFINNLLEEKEIKELMLDYDIEYYEVMFNSIETRLKCEKLFYSCIKKHLKTKEEIEETKAIERYKEQLQQEMEEEKINKEIKEHQIYLQARQEEQKKQENEKTAWKIGIIIAILVIYCYMKMIKWIIML